MNKTSCFPLLSQPAGDKVGGQPLQPLFETDVGFLKSSGLDYFSLNKNINFFLYSVQESLAQLQLVTHK